MRILTMAAAIFGVGLVVAFGGYLTFLGFRNVVRASQSRHWPTTAGLVVAAETQRDTTTDRKTHIEHVNYSTRTVVRYSVDGRDYSTNLIHIGQTLGSSDPSAAELQRLRYPPGTAVQVSYDRQQPWLAVLKPGVHADAFGLPAGGLAFLLPALMAAAVLPDWFGARDRFGGSDITSAVVVTLFGLVFMALGLAGLGFGISRIWNGYASQRWPTTLGEVIFAKVESSQHPDDSTGAVEESFSPTFVYRYQVAGVQHFNNLRRFGRVEGEGSDWAADIAARYPLGTRMQVAYFPDDPDVSVLETGNSREALWLPGVGLVAFLFSLAAFIWVVPGVARG